MRHISFALVALFAVFAGPAGAASDASVLRKFGMLGRYAVNCANVPATSNPHLIYAISPKGAVTRTLEMAEPDLDGTFVMRKLRLLAPDRLQYKETGRELGYTITFARMGSKFRSWKSVRSDGEVIIQDGKFRTSGSPTLVFEPCAY